MKKLISLLLALGMLFTLCACSLDTAIAAAENKVVNIFGINAKGDARANEAAFAANACLVLIDAASAAEQLRAYISCATGYLDAAGTLDETVNADETAALIKQAYDANEGRSYDSMKNSLSSASIGLENLRITLPEDSSVCSSFFAKVENAVTYLNNADALAAVLSEESLSLASEELASYEDAVSGLYESISVYRTTAD